MCLPFGFSFQEIFLCLFYCLRTAFECEFQHIDLCKIIFFSMIHIMPYLSNSRQLGELWTNYLGIS
jgi:hypothetical protein